MSVSLVKNSPVCVRVEGVGTFVAQTTALGQAILDAFAAPDLSTLVGDLDLGPGQSLTAVRDIIEWDLDGFALPNGFVECDNPF